MELIPTQDFSKAEEHYKGYLAFQKTELSEFLNNMPHKTIAIFSGNRGGKTGSVAKHMVDRVRGMCKIPEKNLLARKIRCMSSTLPEQASQDEDDNAQYIELKKRIPGTHIIKDITSRSQNLIVKRPVGLNTDRTIFEFRSSKQDTQDLGKINLSCVWHDEETPKEKRSECRRRLMEEKGDEIFTLTAINPLTYVFYDVWDRASYIRRSDTIVDLFNVPKEEWPNKNTNIACYQMATDDNPILDIDEIEANFEDITDPDDLAIRRYGFFRQMTGRVVKTYDPLVCRVSKDRYFPDGIPYNWVHARGIDYHESRTPWSVGWLSASPEDEWFMWQEFHPSIDGPHAYNTYEIANAIARKSGDYIYQVNLIDPLANKKQANTGFSTTEDLNRYFHQIREESGVGSAAFWEGWDTKGTKGRDEVSKRFKNAVRCGRPFNNTVKERGVTRRLPTLWLLDTVPKTHKSVKNWCFGEYVQEQSKAVNDPKIQPQQKNSHDNMVLEAFAKDNRLLYASHLTNNPPSQMRRKSISVTGR